LSARTTAYSVLSSRVRTTQKLFQLF
jgi:hypothetical protein